MKNKKRISWIDNEEERIQALKNANWNKNYKEQNRCKASDRVIGNLGNSWLPCKNQAAQDSNLCPCHKEINKTEPETMRIDTPKTESPLQKPPLTVCSRCGGKAEKGLFRYACPMCQPLYFQPCLKCGAKRLWCCC